MDSAAVALTTTRPQLAGMAMAREALGLAPMELLHAGPPLSDPRRPPPVLLSSVAMTCLYEGWAADEAEAEALVLQGKLRLMPAQDRACVTPLAAVVSLSTPLLQVRGAAPGSPAVWSPVSTVRGSDTRMGLRDPALPGRLRRRDEGVVPALAEALAQHGPIDLWPLALSGLADGDDLHNRVSGANAALARWLQARGAQALAADIAATPLFFLTVWMAASALVLRSAEGKDLPTLVTRAGGNGERFGIGLAGRPDRWTACEAVPPRGPFLPAVATTTRICGAIGDSAVIDMLGLGGQRLAFAPEPLALVRSYLPVASDALEKRARALLRVPGGPLPDAWPLGVDAAGVVDAGAPLVMLAMLAQDGLGGFLGRGVYCPPVGLFDRAAGDLR